MKQCCHTKFLDGCQSYPHKAGWEPTLLIIDLPPPPILVGGIQDLNDVSCLKCQLAVSHGHMIPYCLSTDDGTSADQLKNSKSKTNQFNTHVLLESGKTLLYVYGYTFLNNLFYDVMIYSTKWWLYTSVKESWNISIAPRRFTILFISKSSHVFWWKGSIHFH